MNPVLILLLTRRHFRLLYCCSILASVSFRIRTTRLTLKPLRRHSIIHRLSCHFMLFLEFIERFLVNVIFLLRICSQRKINVNVSAAWLRMFNLQLSMWVYIFILYKIQYMQSRFSEPNALVASHYILDGLWDLLEREFRHN